MKIDKKTRDKLWWMCHEKFGSFSRVRGDVIETWLEYLKTHRIQVRKSRESFYKCESEDMILFSGFYPRRSYKIGIPYELAEKILVLGMP
jgi:hypothetical protein